MNDPSKAGHKSSCAFGDQSEMNVRHTLGAAIRHPALLRQNHSLDTTDSPVCSD